VVAITKKQSDRLLWKIYRHIRNEAEGISLKRLRGAHGEIDCLTGEITLDPAGRLLPAIIHECLHGLFADWPETTVEAYERAICAKLTPQQWENLMARLLERLQTK